MKYFNIKLDYKNFVKRPMHMENKWENFIIIAGNIILIEDT